MKSRLRDDLTFNAKRMPTAQGWRWLSNGILSSTSSAGTSQFMESILFFLDALVFSHSVVHFSLISAFLISGG